MTEHETAVLGGGGMTEHKTAVLGGNGIADRDRSMLGAVGMAEQSSSVLGAVEIAVQDSAVTGGGGMTEHKTAVLGGGGILVQDSAVLGGGGMTDPGSIPLCCGLSARQARPTARTRTRSRPGALLGRSRGWNHVPFGQNVLKGFTVLVRAVPANGAGDEQQGHPEERHP
jgi:hypothetical protein